MADWSRLPPELVVLIAKHLTTRFDILRFRSVCPSWRSSVPPKVDPLPTPLPSKKQGRYERSQINFVRNTFYLVRSCHGGQTETPACWFVKIRDTTDRVQLQLVYPSFWDFMWNPRPENFPKVIDLTRFQVFELGHEYLVNYNVDVDHSLEPRHEYFEDKVVFLRTHTGSHTGFIMFILRGCTLSFLRSGDKEWACLQDLHDVQDIISFNGKVYAIARGGRTIIIDPTLKVSFFEHGVGSSSTTKFLVESVDDLLAVEKLSNPANSESPVRFRVFRMNEEEQKWDEMGSLRDQILFLVSEQAISAPASDFGWGKGNLIFYSKGLSNTLPYGNPKDRLMLVFDLETGTTTNILENCPGHRNLLFWPPPQWITCPESSISHHTSYSTHLTTSETIEEEEEEVDGARRSPSSKCNFKFCCF